MNLFEKLRHDDPKSDRLWCCIISWAHIVDGVIQLTTLGRYSTRFFDHLIFEEEFSNWCKKYGRWMI